MNTSQRQKAKGKNNGPARSWGMLLIQAVKIRGQCLLRPKTAHGLFAGADPDTTTSEREKRLPAGGAQVEEQSL
jgi:hypothetical protein